MPDYTLSAKITGDSSGYKKAIDDAEKSTKSFEKRLEGIANKAKSIGDKISGIGTKLTVGVTTPITLAGKSAVSTAAEFESSMSRTQGALNATSAEMESLTDLAMEMGAKTIFSASDAGDAMNELAKGGLTSADIQAGALKSTMDLAASSGMDMATSANTIVKAMGGFQLSAEQTEEAVNALAGAAASSAADVSDISYALAQAAASANNAGWSIQDTTAALAAFADAGIVGSDAGTSLKTMLQRLSAPTDDAAALMDILGINVYDTNGHMLDAAGVAQELQEALAGLGDQQRAQALDTIFGADATRAATVLMNEGAEGIRKYTQATNDQTAAARMADAQLGPLQKSIENMKGSIETASIAIGDLLTPRIQAASEGVTDLVNRFSEMEPEAQKSALRIAGVAAAAGPALIVLGKLTSGIGSITTGFKMFLSPSNKIIAILAALAAGFAFLMTTNDDFRSSISESLAIIGDAAATILPQLLDLLGSIGGFLADTIAGVLESIAPFVAGIFNTVAQFVEFVANNFDVIGPLIAGIGAAFLTWNVISMVTSLIQTLSQLPTLLTTLGGGVKALNAAISANPIAAVISLIAGLVTAIMLLWNKSEGFRNAVLAIWDSLKSAFTAAKNFIVNLFDQVVSVVSGAIDRIRSIISTVAGFFQGAFESAASIVQNIINGIGDFFAGFVQTVKSSWSGLTNFVSGIFSGISSAFDSLVSGVKSVINTVIRGINGAIGIINLIPGVNIGKISYLLHGTDDWQGGFAYMNEGGRGELTYLPNGAQVIPHDISVQYAKAAARENRGSESIDLSGVLDGVVIQVINNTSVDGTPLKESISDYTIRRIGNQQRAYNRSRGLSYA